MPIVLKLDNPKGQCVSVWKTTETLEDLLQKTKLSDEERVTMNSFSNESRKREWLAVRTLLQSLRPFCPTIKYKDNGKPYLADGSEEISISHSGPYIAIALTKIGTPGVDIEQVHPKIKRIAERFVNEKEKAFIKEDTLIEQLCLLWCAKEVLYKIHPKGMLSFKNNLLVSPFILSDTGQMEGTINVNNSSSVHKLSYHKIDNCMLVYTD